MATADINEHKPPCSAEEAAALLGAAISFSGGLAPASAASSFGSGIGSNKTKLEGEDIHPQEGRDGDSLKSTHHENPPPGMHSIFVVQTPVPNGTLFIRLCNLRTWLEWHAALPESKSPTKNSYPGWKVNSVPISGGNEISIQSKDTMKQKYSKEPFAAARSILAVLMKLLEVSSAVANGESGKILEDNSLSSSTKTKPSYNKQKSSKQLKQHKPLPPLLSTPLRTTWVECISLCLALGASLPGNLRIDVSSFLSKMMEISNWNPKSKMAAGGVRLAALQVIGRVCELNNELAKRTAPYAWEIIQCCHKGLLSGGAGEPGHREACVKAACGVAVACRRAVGSVGSVAVGEGNIESFANPGAMEDRAVVEAIKFVKRAVQDKYPEIRKGAAVFAGLTAPMLIRIAPISTGMGNNADDISSPLALLEELTQVALKNIDDESAGVGYAWAAAVARCLCASVEHGKSVRHAQSEEQSNKRSSDVDDDDFSPSDSSNLDLAAKLKAFSEGRRAAAATASCSSEQACLSWTVTQFVKCGGEAVSNKCGGSYSIGGRASRIGYANILTEFLRLQSAKGEFKLTEAAIPVLGMVGTTFEKQIQKAERTGAHQSLEDDFHAPSSPYSSPEKKNSTASISSAFSLSRNARTVSSSDSSIARLLTSTVLRKGISENLSETAQLKMLQDLTVACRSSVSYSNPDCSIDSVQLNDTVDKEQLNRHQVQVILIEMSHLIVAIGEAAASSLEDLMPLLQNCLAHPDHGVRHEAAVSYAAVLQAFPSEGRKYVMSSLGGFSANIDAIKNLSMQVAFNPSVVQKNRFRKPALEDPNTKELIRHQCTMHGNSLAVSVLMHEFTHIVGGVSTEIIAKVFNIVKELLNCQYDENFVKANPSAVCTCVRAGYCMLSGTLTMGIEAVVPIVRDVFTLWQTSSLNVLPGVSKFNSSHDLLIVESILSSVVSFLKFSPDLILAVPDALNRLTALLEKLFPLISFGGRLEGSSQAGGVRLASARSSIMEAYSWLPPGSFPMSADRIFSFASRLIQDLSGNDIASSMLQGLVSREDNLLEAHSYERAVSPGEVGSSVSLDANISIRSSEIVNHQERESILHLTAWKKSSKMLRSEKAESILGDFLSEGECNAIPTPLHEVGTWREPLDPIGTSKVRLLDSAIHVFAATFGLQDGHTQADALRMLDTLHTASQIEKQPNRFNVSTSLIAESQGKVKPREENIPSINVAATILACLQALPLHESNYDTLIGVGPPWMEKATGLLLRLLPSPSTIIRRGAAEGLSYLATLGVSEDAHTLQSQILHSLDEVMKGNTPGLPLKAQAETISFARAGSLLTLACIQRASKRIKRSEDARATSRSVSRTPGSLNIENDATPFMIMMTRILPSLSTHHLEGDSSLVRLHALHSFGVLVSNSVPKTIKSLSPHQTQIIWKAVEAVETSFLGAWSAVMSDVNKGKEREKFASEPAFLAILLRSMTTLIPWLGSLSSFDQWIASRFCLTASVILKVSSHPVVRFEGTVFFEQLSAHEHLLGPNSSCITNTDKISTLATPFLISLLQPNFPNITATGETDFSGCYEPVDVQRCAVTCLKGLCSNALGTDDAFISFEVVTALFSFLHDRVGRRNFQLFPFQRSLATSRAVGNGFEDIQLLEDEVISLINKIIRVQLCEKHPQDQALFGVRWLLYCKCLVSGDSTKPVQSPSEGDDFSIAALADKATSFARRDVFQTLKLSNPPRWQLKCIASNAASTVVNTLLRSSVGYGGGSVLFNYIQAQSLCIAKFRKQNNIILGLHSYPAFHVEELVTSACSASAATSNHSELPLVQISGLRFLTSLLNAFGKETDTSADDGSFVLSQFSSQIISAVKHGLNAEKSLKESLQGTWFHRLFLTGCDALLVLIASGLVTEPIALKRLIQPVMLPLSEISTSQISFERRDETIAMLKKSINVIDDPRSPQLFKLAKLIFAAKITNLISLGKIDGHIASLISCELEEMEEGISIHAAATAIDGFLLKVNNHHQCQVKLENRGISSGLTYKNIADLDDSVIEELIENWPHLAAYAVTSMVKALKNSAEICEKRRNLQAWCTRLIPTIVSGLSYSLEDVEFSEVNFGASSYKASSSITPSESFVHALRMIVRENSLGKEALGSSDISFTANIITNSVIFPFLGLTEPPDTAKCHPQKFLKGQGKGEILMEQCCGFIEDVCENMSELSVHVPTLARSALYPLVALQEGRILMDDNNVGVISSCIRSSRSIILSHHEKESHQLKKSLLQLMLSILGDSKFESKEPLDDLRLPCLNLLKTCLEKTPFTAEELCQLATFSAKQEAWDVWVVVCSTLPPGAGIMCSINALRAALADLAVVTRHTGAIVALQSALQVAISGKPSLMIAVMHSLGPEMIQLLKSHTLRVVNGPDFDKNRMTACAELLKMNMMAFQCLNSMSAEESKIVSFLMAVFDVLVDAISFNGVPNNPSGKDGAEEVIGQLCARIFVNVARTTPQIFKSTMATMSIEHQSVIESAVRADMSGYAQPKTISKKKLSLKGFVRK